VNADVAGALVVIMQSTDGQGRQTADVRPASPCSCLPSRRLRVLSHVACVGLLINRGQAGGTSMSDQGTTRREVIKKAVYVTPVLLTLKANLEFASAGSGLHAPSDRGVTGGSGQTTPVEPTPPESGTVPPDSAAPGGSTPPPLHDPPPAGSDSAPSDHLAPVSSEPPPAEHTRSDDAASPPHNDPVADHPRKRRRLRRHHRRHVL
jgi:hypothetical protein